MQILNLKMQNTFRQLNLKLRRGGPARHASLQGVAGGQAMLVVVLMVFVSGVAMALAVAVMGLAQTNIVSNFKLANQADNLAESCLENALMRLTRDVSTVPPALSAPTGTCTININGSNPNYQILAVAEIPAALFSGKKATQKIQATVSIVNGVTTVTKWEKVY